MPSTTQGLDITLAELKAAGQLNLDRNLASLDEACAEFAPGASVPDCNLKVQNRKPPDPTWSEEDQLAYIPGETVLLAISVHEIWATAIRHCYRIKPG